jgi:hypothetical protein
MSVQVKHLYSDRAEERRRQFNNIIRGIDMVLMNNIPEVDQSVYDNWEGDSPLSEQCDIEESQEQDNYKYHCNTHGIATNDEYECEEYEGDDEVYQWFAVGSSDADFLKRHGQYITYSDMLDTYFLAICHFGTSWDYVDSMVHAFDDLYTGLEDFKDKEK